MTNSASVRDFQFIERDPGYDKANNPLRRTVAELMPIGISWRCNGVPRSIQNAAGVGAVLLTDSSGIALVEGPYDSGNNNAYIVNCDGSARAQVSPSTTVGHVMFYDVLYSGGNLMFLGATSDRDVQIHVNERDGTILHVAEFR